MSKFHPAHDLLTEHAAGTLSLAESTCISAHLHYCEQCRRSVSQLQDLGAALFETQEGLPVGDALLDKVLARLDELPPLGFVRDDSAVGRVPALLQRLMNGDFSELAWKKVTDSLRVSRLQTGDPAHEVALYHIKAGGRIPEHTHHGSEMTLVLQGGFSDADGSYHQGDFLFRSGDDIHAPTALQSEDCICLAVLDAPLKFTGWKHRWMNPFLRLQPG